MCQLVFQNMERNSRRRLNRMEFEHEDPIEDPDDEHAMRKKSIAFGFSAMLDSIIGQERSKFGYTKLEPETSNIHIDKIILDPHSPLTWSTSKHFVQRPTPYDALEGLASDKMALIPRDSEIKAIEDKTSSSGSGKDVKSINSAEDKKKKEDEQQDKNTKFLGIFLAAVSGLFFTLCSVMVKMLPRIDPSEVLLFRAIVQFVLTIPIMIFAKANPLGPKEVRVMVYVQGVVGCFTVTCIFIGFARLPVGDAATIIFCSPIFVMIFSHVILREHCGIFRFLVIGLLMFGVILIAKPPFLNKIFFGNDNSQLQQHHQDTIGYCAALIGTLLTASNFVCMRRLRHVHFSVLIFAFSVMSGFLSAAIVPFMGDKEFKIPRTNDEWMYSVLVGVFGLLGQSLLAVALRYETAGVVSVTRSMDIAVAYIIQIVWFGDIPLWTSILGAFVVIMAVFMMAMEDAVLSLLKTHFGSSGWC